jgi:hypothetical protein
VPEVLPEQGSRLGIGHGRSNAQLHHLTLSHGDAPWDLAQPRVNVQTRLPRRVHDDPQADLAIERHSLTREQVGIIWRATGRLPTEIRAAAFQSGDLPSDPTTPWEQINLPVDNRSLPFKVYRQDETWVAQSQHDDVLIAIDAHSWPLDATGLVTITRDRLKTYEDGSRLVRARHPVGPT